MKSDVVSGGQLGWSVAVGTVLLLSACSAKTVETTGRPASDSAVNVTKQLSSDEVSKERSELTASATAIAERADRGIVDGWICGEYSRALKSGYLKVDPATKADFAIAYHEMVDGSGQNLANDLASYLPFSKRAEFALDWWKSSKYGDTFAREKKNKKLLWLYESMLDAGELFWRAYEMKYPNSINSADTMAHYKEHEMVFNYMESQMSPSTFSEQYAKWKSKL